MKILGIETSTPRAGLAIVDGERIIAEAILPGEVTHSASLIPTLDGMLKEHNIGLKDLRGIAVGIGPGSFTGIRLGLAVARGLSFSLGIPIRGVCGFDNVLAECEVTASRICPLINAHSYGFYTAVYEKKGRSFTRAGELFVCQPDELAGRVKGEIFFMGPHLGRFREALARVFGPRASFDDSDSFPTALSAVLLYESPIALRDDPPGAVGPLYILPGVRVRSVSRR